MNHHGKGGVFMGIKRWIFIWFCFSILYGNSDTQNIESNSKDLLFYASFDNQVEVADFSKAGEKGKVSGEIETTEGIKGKAVVVGGKGSIIFEGEKNFSVQSGTISFWFSPVDWDGSSQGTVILLRMTVKNDNVAWVSRYEDRKTWGNALSVNLYGVTDDGKMAWGGVYGRYGSASKIKKGQWYHFLVTWNDSLMYIYLNGEEQGHGSRKLLRQPDSISIGPGKVSDIQPQTAIDEVKIFNKFFSQEEIRKLFQEGLPKNSEDYIF